MMIMRIMEITSRRKKVSPAEIKTPLGLNNTNYELMFSQTDGKSHCIHGCFIMLFFIQADFQVDFQNYFVSVIIELASIKKKKNSINNNLGSVFSHFFFSSPSTGSDAFHTLLIHIFTSLIPVLSQTLKHTQTHVCIQHTI